MTKNLENKKVVLVDGSGYIFRAFYALPSMTKTDGTPVNAVYGFSTMMMKLLSETDADYLCVVFDCARKTFRMDIYPEYKGTRKETPDELKPQFPLLRQAVDAFGIAQIEMEGFEADDLLATYARIAKENGASVTVVSADKDLMQLVGSDVIVYDPMKHKKIDTEQVIEKFGVTPDKVIDVQALAGDSSDNVPGVRGIGLKTAADLITQFGNLENLLENIPSIKQPKRREMLENDKELAIISKKLVTLDAFAPVEKNINDFEFKKIDYEKLAVFFDEMNFKSLKNKVLSISNDTDTPVEKNLPIPEKIPTKYSLLQTLTELKKQLQNAVNKGYFAIDTETDSLNALQANMIGFSFSYNKGEAFYVPLRHKSTNVQTDLFGDVIQDESLKQIPINDALEVLKPVLENPKVIKIGHNIKYDWHIFKNEIDSLNLQNIEDTMVMSYDLNGANHLHNMDDLADIYLDHKTIEYAEVCNKGRNKITFDYVPLDKACEYAAEDADITLRLYDIFKNRLEQENLSTLYETLDKPSISVLFNMERQGINIDENQLKVLSTNFGQKLNVLQQEIVSQAGEEFNLNSPLQLGKILFEKLGFSGGKKNKKTGAWGTDAKVLETLADENHKIAKDLLEYRQFSKLKSTYTDALQAQINPKTKRVHTTFGQTITSTGRLSSTDPNLQNIPIRLEEGREIRKAFVAKENYTLIAADYSQVELRLMAHVAGVSKLKEAFMQNLDIHAATASEIFNTPIEGMDPMVRRSAKAINFGIIYGMSAFGLAKQLLIDRHEAQSYIDAYFAKYPEIKTYMQDTLEFARTNGFVMTPFGRKCFIKSINDKNGAIRQFAERSAINAPIQGGAADIIKKAMIELPIALIEKGLNAKLLLQVHDELILEVPETEINETKTVVKDVMEKTVSLSIPLIAEVGVGKNWAEAH